jgi:hypothetical protein
LYNFDDEAHFLLSIGGRSRRRGGEEGEDSETEFRQIRNLKNTYFRTEFRQIRNLTTHPTGQSSDSSGTLKQIFQYRVQTDQES